MARMQCGRISIAVSSKPANARNTRDWRAARESNRRRDRSLLIFTFAATVFLFQVRVGTDGGAGRPCQPLAIALCDHAHIFLSRDAMAEARVALQGAGRLLKLPVRR